MKIDLANIAGTPGARGRFPISEAVAATEDYTVVGPVTGELTVDNTGSLLLLRGKLQAMLRLTCARCLTVAEQPIEMEVEEEFASETTADDVETIDREEPEAAAISDFVLDAGDLVRQQIGLNLPMAFLCRYDCHGICPSCGKNLNEGPCGCPQDEIDARWTKLADMARQGKTKNRK